MWNITCRCECNLCELKPVIKSFSCALISLTLFYFNDMLLNKPFSSQAFVANATSKGRFALSVTIPLHSTKVDLQRDIVLISKLLWLYFGEKTWDWSYDYIHTIPCVKKNYRKCLIFWLKNKNSKKYIQICYQSKVLATKMYYVWNQVIAKKHNALGFKGVQGEKSLETQEFNFRLHSLIWYHHPLKCQTYMPSHILSLHIL